MQPVRAASECLAKVSRVTLGEPNDLLDSLRDENEALLVRVAHLEATTDEYRRQMEGLLTSSSWRITAPLRSFAASVRLARRRIRQLPERLAPRPAPAAFCTTGLFPSRSAATRRTRNGCQPVAGASRARDGSSAAAASRLAVGRPGTRRRPCLSPGGLVRHRGPARPDPGAVRPRRLAGRRPHRGARAGDRRAAAARDDPPRPEPRSRSRLARRVGRSRGLRRLRRDSQGAHQAQPAPDRRGCLASGAARRVAAVARRHPPDHRAAPPRSTHVGLVVPTGQPPRRRRRGAPTKPWSRHWRHEFPSPSIPTCCATRPARCTGRGRGFSAGSRIFSSDAEHFEPEGGHVDGSTAHALERFVGVAAQASGLDIVDASDVSLRLHRARRTAAPAAEGARLLPAAVPPDPRERRLVGDGVHRLGERRSRPPALRRITCSRSSPASSDGTTCRIPM